jgi:hypothetical protein
MPTNLNHIRTLTQFKIHISRNNLPTIDLGSNYSSFLTFLKTYEYDYNRSANISLSGYSLYSLQFFIDLLSNFQVDEDEEYIKHLCKGISEFLVTCEQDQSRLPGFDKNPLNLQHVSRETNRANIEYVAELFLKLSTIEFD